jgi:hypothetical protein
LKPTGFKKVTIFNNKLQELFLKICEDVWAVVDSHQHIDRQYLNGIHLRPLPSGQSNAFIGQSPNKKKRGEGGPSENGVNLAKSFQIQDNSN